MENNGLAGLGNINTDNASATVETPGAAFNKVYNNGRTLETNPSRFSTTQELTEYLLNWFNNTGVCKAYRNGYTDCAFNLEVNSPTVAVSAYVVCALTENEAYSMLDQFMKNAQYSRVNVPAIMGYFNSDAGLRLGSEAKAVGLSLIGNQEIMQINAAVSDNFFLSVGSKKLGDLIAKALHEHYKGEIASEKGGTIPGMGNFGNDSNNLGNAFQEGINQLGGSVKGLLASFGLAGNQQQSMPVGNPNANVNPNQGNPPYEAGNYQQSVQNPNMDNQQPQNMNQNIKVNIEKAPENGAADTQLQQEVGQQIVENMPDAGGVFTQDIMGNKGFAQVDIVEAPNNNQEQIVENEPDGGGVFTQGTSAGHSGSGVSLKKD